MPSSGLLPKIDCNGFLNPLKRKSKQYKAAFAEVEDLEAENEQLARELDAAKRGSITEKLEQAKLQREYRDAKAILDRIPPEILNQLRKESLAVQRDTPEDLRH